MATAKKTSTPRTTTKGTATKTAATRTSRPATPRKTAATKAATTKAPAKGARVDQGRTISLGAIDLNTAEVKALVTDSAYATLGAGDRIVELARDLPSRLEALRTERAAEVVKANRSKAETFVKEAPAKLQAEVSDNLEAARKELLTYAERGRKVIASISGAPTTKRALEQTETARSQVKGAVTSIRKAVEQSQDALEGAAGRIGVRRS